MKAQKRILVKEGFAREVSTCKLLKKQAIISVIRKLDKDALNLYSGARCQGADASFDPKN